MILDDLNMYYSGGWGCDKRTRAALRVDRFVSAGPVPSNSFATFDTVLQFPGLHAEVNTFVDGRSQWKIVPAKYLDLSWPKVGLFNYSGRVLNVSRISARSVAKAMTTRTLSVSPICPQIDQQLPIVLRMNRTMTRYTDVRRESAYKFMNELYSPTYYKAPHAVQLLLSSGNHFSCALNRHLALSIIPGFNQLGIYLYSAIIGTYNVRSKEIAFNNLHSSACKAVSEEVLNLFGGEE